MVIDTEEGVLEQAERRIALLDDVVVLALQGMGHFGPWIWPDLILGLVAQEPGEAP